MSRISRFTSSKTFRNSFISLCVIFITFAFSVAQAAPNIVTTHQDANGWKLKVDGKDTYIKGYVWGYSPKGENYSYNLWGQDDEFIKKVLEQDFSLMKKANVNAIRTFSTIPPKWVTYIYRKYGIMSAINPLMGRYGATINGEWIPNTDYSDPVTRKVLKEEVLADVRKYKDVPGVLMFALGNESNYGLSWSSFEIENLPTAEARNVKKATYLYTLYEEVISAGKAISRNHPWSIVNGDIQYIDLIQKHVKSLDVLGVNAYRGISFTALWKDVKAKLGLPVLFFEFGSDAFNSKEFREDQKSQAQYLKGQWQEMYQKSYGNGQEGNSIGGFVFQWRDEWWKFKQTENLDKQDTNASWANGGYKYDFVEGQNNMNEEWWGVSSIGPIDSDGVYKTQPRMAYDVLAQVWSADPYAGTASFKQTLNNVKFDSNKFKDAKQEKFSVTGGSLYVERLVNGDREVSGRIGDRAYSNTVMAFMDFAFQPTKNIEGDFTVNLIGSASESVFDFRYGDRVNEDDAKASDKIEIYDFQATYTGENFDLNGFYHVPRYHWGDEGDYFGLLRETTDLTGANGQDIWNAKAPSGIEFVGKKSLDGLKITGGKEIYWGANPKAILKYQFGDSKQYTFMHSEDFKQAGAGATGTTDSASVKTRQTTLQGKLDLGKKRTLEIGGIVSGTNKRGETYFYEKDGVAYQNKVDLEDTLGFKAKLSFNVGAKTRAYIATNQAGIVADSGNPLRDFGTELPYSSGGNKREYEMGARYTNGSYTIYPRLLYRKNLIDANPKGSTLPKIKPRNIGTDPFSVLGNRDAKSAELYFTYDPTPGTFFYEWDNDLREDADFAFNVGLTATEYGTATDAHTYYNEEFNVANATFNNTGLPAANVWLLKSKMVFNNSNKINTVLNLEAGKQQSSKNPGDGVNTFGDAKRHYAIQGKLIYNKEHIISAKFVKDGFGPYDFQRDFDVRYPEQYELQYVKLLDKGLSEEKSSKVGIKALYRTMDDSSRSSDPVFEDDKQFEIRAFFEYRF